MTFHPFAEVFVFEVYQLDFGHHDVAEAFGNFYKAVFAACCIKIGFQAWRGRT
ncbi:hypothetical protein D9M69_717180 [compost metagenome]